MVNKQDIKTDLYDYTYGDGADLIDHAPEYIEYLLNELERYEKTVEEWRKYDDQLVEVLKHDSGWLGRDIVEHAVNYIQRLERRIKLLETMLTEEIK